MAHKWQKATSARIRARTITNAGQRRQFEAFSQTELFDRFGHIPGFVLFTRNPAWREAVQAAPTEALREYLAWNFALSSASGGPRSRRASREMNRIEASLTRKEWQYLIDAAPGVTAKIGLHCRMKAILG